MIQLHYAGPGVRLDAAALAAWMDGRGTPAAIGIRDEHPGSAAALLIFDALQRGVIDVPDGLVAQAYGNDDVEGGGIALLLGNRDVPGWWPAPGWREVREFAVRYDAPRPEAGTAVRDTLEAAIAELNALLTAAGGASGPTGNS